MRTCSNCQKSNQDTARFCSNCGAPLFATAGMPTPGTVVGGRYQIDRKLGQGGFGAAYLATDQRLKRACVVKVMVVPPGASQSQIDDLRLTFEREAGSLTDLNHPGHPNIPEIYDFFSDATGNFLVMKFVDGETLEEQAERVGGKLAWSQASTLGVQITSALAYMHGRTPPVLHRDIKPANLLVDATGRVFLVDFGLSKAQPQAGGVIGKSLPQGTPGYAPPEQYSGRAEPRSDVYALAATLYDLITGDGDRSDPFSFRELKTLPQPVKTVLQDALQTDVSKRPTAARLHTQLEALIAPKPAAEPIHLRSGAVAGTVAELAAACDQHWDDGKYHLYRGDFEERLRKWGRTDLETKTVAVRQQHPNHDLGLDAFLRLLDPAYPAPRVQVMPLALDLGVVPWGDQRTAQIEVQNTGHGCLQGHVVQTPWLRASQAEFVTHDRQLLQISVNTAQMTPQGQSHVGQLILDAGLGGQAQVTVTVTVPEPRILVNSKDLNLGTALQGETRSTDFTVSNQGSSPCQISVASSAGWATISPDHFLSAPGRSVQIVVTANSSRMSLGTHKASLAVIAEAGAWRHETLVPVTVRLPWLKTFVRRQRKALLGLGVVMCLILLFAAFQGWRQAAYNQGQTLLASSQWEQAAKVFERVGAYTEMHEAHYRAGQAYQAGQQWAQAVVAFAQAGAYRDAPALSQQAYFNAGPLRSPQDGMEQVLVPAGEFTMGSPDGQGSDNEHPQHTVALDTYWIDKTEVTVTHYRRCVEAGACSAPGAGSSDNSSFCAYNDDGKSDHPIDCVDWRQAEAYCEWAGRRLPTEAEWEKAARGTDGRAYPWGDQAPDPTLANFDINVGNTTPAGHYPAGASPYGALDMAGNVDEWVADWYSKTYYASSQRENPSGPIIGYMRVSRGGSHRYPADLIRAAFRSNNRPDLPVSLSFLNGFRCARSP